MTCVSGHQSKLSPNSCQLLCVKSLGVWEPFEVGLGERHTRTGAVLRLYGVIVETIEAQPYSFRCQRGRRLSLRIQVQGL